MLLEVTDLRLAYGRLEVVHGVSLQVQEGEFAALIGLNGAGKSTTVHALAGLHAPASGSIRFRGENIAGNRADRVLASGVSAALGGRRLFRKLSVRDNLRLGAYSRSRAESGETMEEVQSIFPVLRHKIDDPAVNLSGGEQQMLAIAQALMSRPRLLLLDEPSAGLAPLMIGEVFAALQALRQQGLALLLIEQVVDQALDLCDTAYVMDRGEIVLEGPAREVRDSSAVQEIYIGEFGHGTGVR